MKTKMLVVDNEAPIRTALCKILNHFGQGNFEIEEAEGVADGLKKIQQFHPDIVFLDIEMDDGSGFDLLDQLDPSRFQLVFTTAHNQYAIRAFEYCALNYLMKPISPSALQKTLQRAHDNLRRQQDWVQQYQLLLDTLGHARQPQPEPKIALKDANGIYFVRISQIQYCEADGPYTRFRIQGASDIVVSKTLREYEDMLGPQGFIRCHHSFLINAANISRYDRNEALLLTLDGSSVPVSTRKKEAVMEALERRRLLGL